MPKPLTNDLTRERLLEEADSAFGSDRDALARAYGFHTWTQVEVYLCHRSEKTPEFGSTADEFLYHACLNYGLDAPERRDRARSLLQDDPSIANVSIYTASCIGDAAEVARQLEADPGSLDRRGGPFDWEPLLYACYSRLNLPERSTVEVVRLLLARGANPNAYYMWGGQYRFTALTGAFGEGEGGPVRQPPHEEWEALARLLLRAGAHPNDSQSIYNRMFSGDLRCIQMLIEHGLTSADSINWIPYDLDEPDGVGTSQKTLDYLLAWDVCNYHTARAKLCIDRGADIHALDDEGRSLLTRALVCGHQELADYLTALGARAEGMTRVDEFAAAVMSGDANRARRMLADEPSLVEQLERQHDELLHDAACSGRVEALRAAIAVGIDTDHCNWRTPLHEAAGSGRLGVVKLLVENGARIGRRDNAYGGSVLDWAVFCHQQEVVDYLSTLDQLEIFEAIGCNRVDRVRELVEADPTVLHQTVRDGRQDSTEPLDYDWKTPLASAITRKHPRMVKLLLELGAPTNVGPPSGQSLVEFARDCSTPEIVQLLESALS